MTSSRLQLVSGAVSLPDDRAVEIADGSIEGVAQDVAVSLPDDRAVEIVCLPPDEWRLYRELRLRALRDAPAAFGSSHDDMAARPGSYWRERLRAAAEAKTDWLLFARRGSDGTLVGMAGAFLSRHVLDADDADVVAMYVVPEARGQGVGGRLLAALLDSLRATGRVRRAGLYVNATQQEAVRLYERAGFSVVGPTRGRLGDGREHDLLHMERSLG